MLRLTFSARTKPPSLPEMPTARPPAWPIQPTISLLIDARQDHLGDLRGLRIGDAQAVDEARFDAEPLEHRADLRAAAMDDDRD